MKYIDVEKLISEIEAREKVHFEDYHINKSGGPADYGAANALHQLLPFIESIQQEKTDLPDNLDEAAEEYAHNNWEDNDYHTGASEGLPFDAIGHTEKCFKAGAEWMARQMKQEKPEVDLEKEIQNYFQGYWPGIETAEQCNTDMHFTPLAILRMVEHFYVFGLNARKEE